MSTHLAMGSTGSSVMEMSTPGTCGEKYIELTGLLLFVCMTG